MLRTIQGIFINPASSLARDDLIAPVLTGTHQGGLVHTAGADGLHQPLHFRIVPHTKGMILERVEVGEIEIDDLLFLGAGRVTGLGRFRRRGLFLGVGRGSALAGGGPLVLAGGLVPLAGRGGGLVLGFCLGSAAPARFPFPGLRRGPVCLGRTATAGLFLFRFNLGLGPLPFLLGV